MDKNANTMNFPKSNDVFYFKRSGFYGCKHSDLIFLVPKKKRIKQIIQKEYLSKTGKLAYNYSIEIEGENYSTDFRELDPQYNDIADLYIYKRFFSSEEKALNELDKCRKKYISKHGKDNILEELNSYLVKYQNLVKLYSERLKKLPNIDFNKPKPLVDVHAGALVYLVRMDWYSWNKDIVGNTETIVDTVDRVNGKITDIYVNGYYGEDGHPIPISKLDLFSSEEDVLLLSSKEIAQDAMYFVEKILLEKEINKNKFAIEQTENVISFIKNLALIEHFG